MIGAVKNELLKLIYSKKVAVIISIMFSFLIINALLLFVFSDEGPSFSWEEELIAERDVLLQMEMTDNVQQQLDVIDFRLKEKIPTNGIESGANDLLAELATGPIILLVIPIFVIIICSELLITEVKEGTLKFSLISPVSRSKILLAKILASFTAIASVLIFYYSVCYIMYSTLSGFGGWTNPTIFIIENEPVIISTWFAILIGIAANILCIFIYIGIALFLSTWLQNVIFVTVCIMLIFMYSAFLSMFIDKVEWLSYFFISNINMYKLFDGSAITLAYVDSAIILFSIVILSIFTLYVAAFLIFKRKDFII